MTTGLDERTAKSFNQVKAMLSRLSSMLSSLNTSYLFSVTRRVIQAIAYLLGVTSVIVVISSRVGF